MTAFTIIGVLVFWSVCWQAGYLIAMACDAKARWDEFLKPATNELAEMVAILTAFCDKTSEGLAGSPQERREG